MFKRSCLILISLSTSWVGVAAQNWPQFRGPNGDGVASSGDLPDRWSTEDNVAWVNEVPGRGWSSPIVWGNRVFATSAISTEAYKEPSTGIYGNDYAAELADQGLSDDEIMERVISRDIELAGEAKEIRYMVYAFDTASGELVWEREAHRGAPFGGRHRKNTYASETPVTDGAHVYAYFGNVGLFCYSMNGELRWTHSWDPQPMYLDFGTASSPVVHDGRVYVQHDNQDASFLAAVDADSGKEIFRAARDGGKTMIRSGWSSPFVWENDARREIVTIGHGVAISYGEDGSELWRMSGLVGQATPTPFAGLGVLFVGTGSQGSGQGPLFAVRPGASGDISLAEGETSNEFVAWRHPNGSAYTSSPLLYQGFVYVVNDNGVLSVFDAKSGRRSYQARAGGVGNTYSASPWAYDGKVFLLSEEGDTFVIRANGEAYEELGKNSLDEMSFASPAIAGDSLFIRTQTKLYRITDSL